MKKIIVSCLVILSSFFGKAQLLTWTSAFIVENDAATNVVITVDATKGNQGLLNHAPTADIYVNTAGGITTFSSGASHWKYLKLNQNFNQPNVALQAAYPGGNKWQFTDKNCLSFCKICFKIIGL